MANSIKSRARWAAAVVVGGLVLVSVVAIRRQWIPVALSWLHSVGLGQLTDGPTASEEMATLDAEQDHGAHTDEGHGHDEVSSLKLSVQAQGNLGLTSETLQPIRLETFRRTMTVPGILVERPGQTRIEVSTPMAGVITAIHAVAGEAVKPGALLFELRITAEELVESQTELLKTVGDLDVENREIARLNKVTESGAIPLKTLLERQYAKDKLENLLLAQREALRLHGLSEHQIDEITTRRRLFRDLRIVAPNPGESSNEIQLSRAGVIPASYVDPIANSTPNESVTPLIITDMPVHVGQTVAEGSTLAELADYSELYIEGRTFERDAKVLSRVAENGWKFDACFEGVEAEGEIVADLELVYASTEIQVESRTLPFYVRLPNDLLRSVPSPNNHAFIEWRHRPGRRVQLLVPIEEWKDQIVLPVDAIAREGAESYVFQQNGDHFDRVPVRVRYRDASQAVIANDGSIFSGDIVARTGAHQMQMALKNKSGGGVDPHAGHNH